MIDAITLKNFQSWRSVDLNLGRVTMVVGQGDSGKTAILRGLKYALTNQTGDDFIREGNESALVGILVDDRAVVWQKRRGRGAVYQTDAAEYTKTGAAVPTDISNLVGIHELVVDKMTTLMPQIQMQWDAPFIVSESGSRVARILGRLTKLNVLIAAQMACKRAAENEQRRAAEARRNAEHYAQELARVPDPAELYARYEHLVEYQQSFEDATRFLNLATQRVVAAREAEERLAHGNPTKLSAKLDELYNIVRRAEKALLALASVRDCLSELADDGLALDRATEQLAVVKDVYDNTCLVQGVCQSCPWR